MSTGDHPPVLTGVDADLLYLDLKAARERLCRAQHRLDTGDRDVIQGAIDRIDLIGCDLPGWSKFDGGRAGT